MDMCAVSACRTKQSSSHDARFAILLAVAAALMLIPLAISRVRGQEPDRPAVASSEAQWNALAGNDDQAAAAAIEQMAKSPDETLTTIERKLAPVLKISPERIQELVQALDKDSFDEREAAQRELESMGVLAVPELNRALKAKLPLEVEARVKQLLTRRVEAFAISDDERRMARLAPLLKKLDTPRGAAILKVIEPVGALQIVDRRIVSLYPRLQSPVAEVRAEAALQIIALGEPAIPVLSGVLPLLDEEKMRVVVGNLNNTISGHIESAIPALGPSVVPPLCSALANPLQAARPRLAKLLGTIQDDRAIEPLLAALRDKDEKVQLAAREALVKFQDKAVDGLIQALDDKQITVRVQAIAGLGAARDARAAEPLVKALGDENKLIRDWAMDSLRMYGPMARDAFLAALVGDNPHIKNDGKVRASVVIGLESEGEPVVIEALIRELSNEHDEVRSASIHRLSSLWSKATPEQRLPERFLAAMKDPSPNVRRQAAHGLGSIVDYGVAAKDDRIFEVLITALAEPGREVRIPAVQSLGKWRDRRAVTPLLPLLNCDDEFLRSISARALGDIGDPRAVEALRPLLAMKDPGVIYALGMLKDRQSVDQLIALLSEKEDSIRCAAATALGHIRDRRAVEPLIPLLKLDDQSLGAAAGALGELQDPAAIIPLIEAAGENSIGFVRQRFVETDPRFTGPEMDPVARPLESIGPAVIEPLSKALLHPTDRVREVASYVIYSLSGHQDTDEEDLRPVVAPLARSLADHSSVVRTNAALTLARLKDPRAAPVLVDLIATADKSAWMYQNIIGRVGELRSPEGFAALVPLVKLKQPTLRATVARTIVSSQDPRAQPLLRELVVDPEQEVREGVAEALGYAKSPDAREHLETLLKDPVATVRAAAAKGLGRLADKQAADALATVLKDDDMAARAAAAIALVQLEDPRGEPALLSCLQDTSAGRRSIALTAIYISPLKTEAITRAVAAALSDEAQRPRSQAALALGSIGTDAAVDALAAGVSDGEMLRAIAYNLGRTKNPRAAPVLIKLSEDAQSENRLNAVVPLASLEGDAVVDALVKLLSDPAPAIRVAAARGLVRAKAPGAIPQLTAALEDEDLQVRQLVARALRRTPKR